MKLRTSNTDFNTTGTLKKPQLGADTRNEPRFALRDFRRADSMLLQETEKGRVPGDAFSDATLVDFQTKAKSLRAKLPVVVFPTAWLAVVSLPGMQQFVQQRAANGPVRVVPHMVLVDGNFIYQTKSISSPAEMPVSASQLFNG
jgi:hypothetical protein